MTGEFVEADNPTLQATRTKKIVLPDSSICFVEVMDTGGDPQVYDSKHAKVSIFFTDPSGSIGVKDFYCATILHIPLPLKSFLRCGNKSKKSKKRL